MSRILITGVNGYIGRKLARTLSARGNNICGVSLESDPIGLPAEVDYRQLDLTCHSDVRKLLESERVDVVIHLAALVHVRSATLSFADYIRVNYRASEFLFQQAALNGVSRIAFASTIEVYGPQPDGTVVDENTPCNPDSDYARAKLLAEEALSGLARAKNLSYCILRFAPVYAPDFRLNLDKRLYLRAPWLGYHLGFGKYRLSLCSIRNIEAWVERWVAKPDAPSGTFNLADSISYTAREILQLEHEHRRARAILPLPVLPCLAALAVRETLLNTGGRNPGMYTTANFRKLGRSTLYSCKRAEEALGRLPGNIKHDLYEGLQT